MPDKPDFYKLSLFDVNTRTKECKKREISINTMPRDDFFVLIRLSKTTYKPDDEVKFLVIVLDPEMRPFKYDRIKIKLINSIENKTIVDEQRTSNFSVFPGKYKLGTEPTRGKWEIQVQINNAVLKTAKTFFVAEESKKLLKIFLNAPNAISSQDNGFNLNIFVQNSHGKTVKRIINTQAKIFNEANRLIATSEKALGVNGKGSKISFNLRDDLGLQRVSQNYTIKLRSTLNDFSDFYEAERTVKIVHGGRHYIVPDLPRLFKPGMYYSFKAKVYTFNGILEEKRAMQVIARATFSNDPNREHSDSVILKNGVAEFILPTFENAETMTISLEIVGYNVKHTIYAEKPDARILKVFVKSST